ncbi:MAG: SpaH/EbpB family LPXTG-anchored major pilin [Actinomycetia bacterium]|nr:SpaH/EbpB family LPXTG-anchored major pilin [Actinomycetes bacterium]
MRTSRTLRLALATTLAVGMGGVMTAAAASAAPASTFGVVTAPAPDVSSYLVDADADTTLTIHKYLGAPVAGPSDGTEVTGIDLPPLAGVEFTAYEVGGVDLTTNEGWAAAAGLAAQSITQADIAAGSFTYEGVTYPLTVAGTATTGADGTATFDDLGVGFFVVVESDTSGATVGGEPVTGAITPAAPFFVTLPMTHPTELNSWMYEVHAYPKNQDDTITKTVEDLGTVAGNEDFNAAVYTITSGIPEGSAPLGYYVVGDNLDENVTLAETGAIAVSVAGTELTEGTHYVVYGADTGDLRIVFTEAGLAVLEANRGGDVVTTLNVLFSADEGSTVIPNEAWFIPSEGWYESTTGEDAPDPGEDPGNPEDPDSPFDPPTSNEVESLYGQLNVTKTGGDDDAALADAVFSLYFATEGECEVLGAQIASDLTTDADGLFSYSGLQASFFQNGVETTVPQGYCLVETQAPAGYNLLAEPIYFEIDHEGSAGAWTVGPEDLTVENAPSNLGNDLPLTGGAGAAGVGLLGLLLLGGVGAYALKRRRDEHNESTSF